MQDAGVKNFLMLLLLLGLVVGAVAWLKPEWLPFLQNDPAARGKLREENLQIPPQKSEAPARAVKVYRWKDASGRLNLSDKPPPEGTPYETVEPDPNTNVLPAGSAPELDSR